MRRALRCPAHHGTDALREDRRRHQVRHAEAVFLRRYDPDRFGWLTWRRPHHRALQSCGPNAGRLAQMVEGAAGKPLNAAFLLPLAISILIHFLQEFCEDALTQTADTGHVQTVDIWLR